MCRFVPLCASPRRCSDVVFGVKGDPRRPEESQEASSRLGRLKLAKRHPKGSTTEVLGRRKKAEVRLMCDSQTFCSLHHMNRPHTHTHAHHIHVSNWAFLWICFVSLRSPGEGVSIVRPRPGPLRATHIDSTPLTAAAGPKHKPAHERVVEP